MGLSTNAGLVGDGVVWAWVFTDPTRISLVIYLSVPLKSSGNFMQELLTRQLNSLKIMVCGCKKFDQIVRSHYELGSFNDFRCSCFRNSINLMASSSFKLLLWVFTYGCKRSSTSASRVPVTFSNSSS